MNGYWYRRWLALGYALHGMRDLFVTQPHAQIHALAALLVIAAGLYWHIAPWEWVSVIICIGLVIALEAVNTAIEYLTDLVSPDIHPLAGKAKDIAAAAVLVAAISAIGVALIVFGPRLWAVFF
jgi:diacylglycerol kinase